MLARLDVPGAIRSLNVSNAAAVALYAIDRALAAQPRAAGGPAVGAADCDSARRYGRPDSHWAVRWMIFGPGRPESMLFATTPGIGMGLPTETILAPPR